MIQQQYLLNSMGRSIDASGPKKVEDRVQHWSTNKSPTREKHRRYFQEDQLEQIITQLNATEWQIATITVHLFDHEWR